MSETKNGRLEGKVAIITGAADGIGRATALQFAREGSKLLLVDINSDGLKETESLIKKKSGTVITAQTDVSDESNIKTLVAEAVNTYGTIDILCNNAGIGGKIQTVENQEGVDWQRVYSVNVLAAVYAIKYAVKYMKEKKSGSIVNTASLAGMGSGAATFAYSASKAALINLTKTYADHLGRYNIRVNAVCPGMIKTGLTRWMWKMAKDQDKEDQLGDCSKLERPGDPEEIASAILFLASDEASYITGQALPVDGGNTAALYWGGNPRGWLKK